MNKLTRLTINKFRNVAPTTLDFRPGINVLLGRNAAGKTTLLRLLSTLMGVPDETLKDDSLEASYRVSGRALDFEHSIVRKRVTPTRINPDRSEQVGFSDLELEQFDSLTFEINGEITVRATVNPTEVLIEKDGKRDSQTRTSHPDPLVSVINALWSTVALEAPEDVIVDIEEARIETLGRMDESLNQLGSILKIEGQRSGMRRAWNIAHVPTSMRKILFGEIPEGTIATFSPSFLERVAQIIGYDSASARFDIERLNPAPGRYATKLSNLRFFFKRFGEEVSHDLLSYGQKRLLAFFAHADASPDVIIADELVNGLHHEWISACLSEIGERQAFLTSQNPLLLDFLRFESIEEVRHTFIICERAGSTADAQLIWRNLTEEEAESFFLAYQTGIQRVSDILLTKGLW
ncbi:AAA family ATPase [Corallococcus exiguus]|uniref:AAA family ATPase n=1 Tax=Corallococcus exiguus TaxID=83462 RepID=UPI00156045D7|nr:AAA family ATPase [Corallococcus exiguus]NRD68531.1 AAA family ATPase [Corallococcus exiguus]